MESKEFLLAAIAKLGTNDSRSAAYFGVTRTAMSRYRSGERIMDTQMAVRVAEVLGIEPLKVIVSCEKERAAEDKKGFWVSQEKMRFGAAANIFLSLSLAVIFEMTPTPSHAASALETTAKSLYIMLSDKLMRLLRMVTFAGGRILHIFSVRCGFSY